MLSQCSDSNFRVFFSSRRPSYSKLIYFRLFFLPGIFTCELSHEGRSLGVGVLLFPSSYSQHKGLAGPAGSITRWARFIVTGSTIEKDTGGGGFSAPVWPSDLPRCSFVFSRGSFPPGRRRRSSRRREDSALPPVSFSYF